MAEVFAQLSVQGGDQSAYARELFNLLSEPIKEAPVWFDNLTKLWRYEYGMPFDRLPEETVVLGTNIYFPVKDLYSAVNIANMKLRKEQLPMFLERLSDRQKHPDVLFEMRPVRDVNADLRTNYEVQGLGVGNTTLDWQVKGRLINVVFDVKNRSKSLIEHLKQIIPALNQGANTSLPIAPNPEDLFRSVENKLREQCWLVQLQGVWIHSDIKEDEDKLTHYFQNSLNKRKVHFAILFDWQNDAFILARNRIIASLLKRVFRLTSSRRFISREYA